MSFYIQLNNDYVGASSNLQNFVLLDYNWLDNLLFDKLLSASHGKIPGYATIDQDPEIFSLLVDSIIIGNNQVFSQKVSDRICVITVVVFVCFFTALARTDDFGVDVVLLILICLVFYGDGFLLASSKHVSRLLLLIF